MLKFVLVMSISGILCAHPADIAMKVERCSRVVRGLGKRHLWIGPLKKVSRTDSRALGRLMPEGDPDHWRKVFDASSKVRLPGQEGGVYRFRLPDGTTAIARRIKEYPDISKGIHTTRLIERSLKYAEQGDGVKLLGISMTPKPFFYLPLRGGEPIPNRRAQLGEVLLVFEDFHATTNDKGTLILGGDASSLGQLSEMSRSMREAVRDRVLKLLDQHPDPKYHNILWRITRTPSGELVPEVVAIDLGSVPAINRVMYDRSSAQSYLNRKLKLETLANTLWPSTTGSTSTLK